MKTKAEMTDNARKVMADCEIALELLESEQDLGRLRVHWAGAMALVRAVGHVLDKVDGRNLTLRPLVDAAYSRWKADRSSNQIFWNFIHKERNNILKKYQLNTHPHEEIDAVVMPAAEHVGTGEASQAQQAFSIGENLYRPILDGYGDSDDARDVYREALEWWRSELTVLEGNLAASKP